MDPVISETSAACLSAVFRDEPWQDFGFPKRPRDGAWAGSFRPQWRVDLEQKVLQQMLSALTAAHVLAGKIPRDAIGSCVTAYTSKPDVAIAFGFGSQAEGVARLKEVIEEYVASPPEQWSRILRSHIRPETSPDKKFASRLFLGCTKFGISAKNAIVALNSAAP
jgi:hypothetical protein